MDAASKSVVDALLAHLETLPWTVITTRHPSCPPLGITDHDRRRTVEVRPLDAGDTLSLAASVGEGLPAEWVEAIADRAGGHPVFVIELLAAAATHGIDSLPENVEAAITSRLDALPASERALVREASVLGVEIDLELVGATLGSDAAASRPLGRSRRCGRAGPRRQDPFPTPADPARRLRGTLLSAQAVCAPARRPDSRSGRWRPVHGRYSLCSLHFHLAEDWSNSWKASVRAGKEAQSVNAVGEAIVCFERALTSAPHIDGLTPEEWARAAETLADLYELDARYTDAERSYGLALRLGRSSDSRVARLLA